MMVNKGATLTSERGELIRVTRGTLLTPGQSPVLAPVRQTAVDLYSWTEDYRWKPTNPNGSQPFITDDEKSLCFT